MNAKHSALSVEHFTPREVVDAARETMGWIHLDPASCKLANDKLVGAERLFTARDDGLSRPWVGNVFVNPPGGKVDGKSSAVVWWNKLVGDWRERHSVEQAIFVAFSLEFLQTAQRSLLSPLLLPFCVPSSRLKFWTPNARGNDVVEGGSPTHANAIVYLPPRDDPRATRRFRAAFSKIGSVVIPKGLGTLSPATQSQSNAVAPLTR